MSNKFKLSPLSELFYISTGSVNPANYPDIEFLHYSIPAYDAKRSPILEKGSSIKSNKYSINKDSLLVSKLNPRISRVWKVEKGCNKICSTEFIVYQPICDNVNLNFYEQLFKSELFQDELLSLQSGTTGSRMRVTPNTTLSIHVPFPDIEEQQKIAEILSSVDGAIEKTEQVIAKTEEVKKGLMQQLLTKGIGHTEFKESLFGLIPNDWMLVSLSEVADVRDGTHDSPKYQSSGIPFITSKNLRNGKIDFSDCNYITIEDHKKFSVRSFVEKGDILFGMIGTIGSPVIVDIDIDFSIKNVALIKLNKDIVDNRYMKYLLESNLIQKEFSRVSDGGVQKFVALSTIRKLKVPLPNLYEQQKIAKILLNQDSYLDSQFKKLSYLQEIKKGLMQQLLTGQVRVGALC